MRELVPVIEDSSVSDALGIKGEDAHVETPLAIAMVLQRSPWATV